MTEPATDRKFDGMDSLRKEIEVLRQENSQLRSALDELHSKMAEPEEVIRAIQYGEVDALIIQESGKEAIYSIQRFDSVYRAVVEECFPYGVWLAKPSGQILYISPSFIRLLESDFATFVENGQFFFLPDVLRAEVESKWEESRRTGSPFSVEYSVSLSDGSTRNIWTQGILAQTHDGQPHWVGVNIDITEITQIKDEIRQQSNALHEADRRKDEFLAILAHELRNPLAPIRTGLDLLKVAGDDRELAEETRMMMEEQVKQVLRLIDDLFEISRFTRGKLELRKTCTDVCAAVRNALDATRPLVAESGHVVEVSLPADPVYVDGDPVRLAQVFTNLVNNACKYTDSGGEITINASVEGKEVAVAVQDNGVGIAEEHLPKLFQMFSQIDSPLDRAKGGLGIGLSLVHGLIEMHGGTVDVQSDGPGRGSKFTVRLPVSDDRPQAARSEVAEHPVEGTKCRILIVDDNKEAVRMMATVLKVSGNVVETGHDGHEGVALAESFRPHFMLLDIGMPKMNGYEAARYIRSQSWGRDVVLVAVTGWGQSDDRERAINAGFDHHVTKPVEASVILSILNSHRK